MTRVARGITIVGGSLLTERGTLQRGSVHVAADRISATPADHAVVLDVSRVPDAVVLPGLVDLHVHVFRGQDGGVDPDAVGARTGVTTMLDAGSAGAHLFDAFRATTLDQASTRIRALINVATIGITSFTLRGELHEPAYLDEGALTDAVARHRDLIYGIKVRASHNVGGEQTSRSLHFARRVADATRLPLMVHLGPAPCGIEEILDVLGSGDILTHSFSGWPGNTLLSDTGEPRDSVLRARARGVIFDIGYGATGFDSTTAHTLIKAGFLPDTISSDLHAHNPRITGLPTALNVLWATGMSLTDVLTRATHAPAKILGLSGVGRLTPDVSPADVTVLARRPVPHEVDVGGTVLTAPATLVPVLTIRGGMVVHDSRTSEES